MSGEHFRSAHCWRALAAASRRFDDHPKALAEAIGAGDMEACAAPGAKLPRAELPVDARLLLVADELRAGAPTAPSAMLSDGANEEANLSSSSR